MRAARTALHVPERENHGKNFIFMLFLKFSNHFLSQAISPGLVESDNIDPEIRKKNPKLRPALTGKDISATIMYAISSKENVQV